MSLYERRNFLDGSEFGEVNIKGEIKRQKVCNMEIWCECFGKAKADLKRIDANAISAIMAKIEGWQKMSKKSRFGIYGAAAGYERDVYKRQAFGFRFSKSSYKFLQKRNIFVFKNRRYQFAFLTVKPCNAYIPWEFPLSALCVPS